ncbi:hypothetical protein ACF3M2_20820 [Tissierella carlieri]|mgnify:CR=1|jgi:hypothetical protein|uniref:hypothetical protein n=1 Tax=Tissierella TaxID=41273 RepID=UPI00117D8BCE|nr:hypothetical protein [Tissierella sp. P1]MDU5080144.1 hypothetical protein [Bacillota bacterium]
MKDVTTSYNTNIPVGVRMGSLRGKVNHTCDHKRRNRCNMDNTHSTILGEVRYNQGSFLGIILEDRIIYSNSIMSTKENLFYICEEI